MKTRIALVTGASRGIGLGIAHELGLAGATVFVTGRSNHRDGATENLPGTVEATAALVTEAGGRGIPVVCDHTSEADTERLAREIAEAYGRLDLLVNNVWGGYENYDHNHFFMSAAEQPVWRWDKMMATGPRAHYLTSRCFLPLLLQSDRPLLVNISAGDAGKFLSDVQYDVAKYAVTRLAFALHARHRDDGLTALTVYPGFTRTERVEAEAPPEALSQTHSPRFVGRCVVALYADPNFKEKGGQAFRVGDLGEEYHLVDIDGKKVTPFSL